ncbi:DNA-processing protein DprA [Microbacterium sp. YY-01]|uniref:DNA-processing protein DprA n=1 Tax=Microbacterium sp. YY-01 TaxID=3421634 RepID=UPI003D17CF67
MTGARTATSYGIYVANESSADLARQEKVHVEGETYGIDGVVHRSTLSAAGHTVAIMAGGVDRPCLIGHRELLDRVADLGLMISEMPSGATPTRWRFMARAQTETA